MRRLIPLVALALAVVACGDGTSATTTTSSDTTTTTTSTETTTTGATTTTAATTTTIEAALEIEVIVHSNGVELVVDGLTIEPGARIAVDLGGRVHVTASGDVAEEIHIHGYDIVIEVESGVEHDAEFVADIPGIFEVELEDSHSEVFELEVS